MAVTIAQFHRLESKLKFGNDKAKQLEFLNQSTKNYLENLILVSAVLFPKKWHDILKDMEWNI